MTRHRATTGALPGDWRRRSGAKGDAHLFATPTDRNSRPLCTRAILRRLTVEADARPCGDCLVAAIRLAPR